MEKVRNAIPNTATKTEIANPTDEFRDTTKTESFQQLYDNFLSKVLKSKEYSELMDPIIEKIDTDDVAAINDSFLMWDDYKVGYKTLVETMSDVLEIEAPALSFKTIPQEDKNKHPLAAYDDKKKCINVILPENESYWASGKIITPVRRIAHEMWHAYQHHEIDNHGKKAALYQDNFNNYIRASRDSSIENILSYLEQPIEAEAYAFGEKFTISFVQKLIDSLVRERNDFIGKATINSALGSEDEDFLNAEHELKMEQLSKLQKIYQNSRFANINTNPL